MVKTYNFFSGFEMRLAGSLIIFLHFTSSVRYDAVKQQTGKIEQIIKYNRWQQRNGPIIHDVTSVKYRKHYLPLVDFFSKSK